MIIYHFRENDCAYIGFTEAQDSPYLPSFSTLQPPPEKDGFYAVMRNGWVLVEGDQPPSPPFIPYEPIDIADKVRAERDVKLGASDWRVIKSLEAGVPLSWDWSVYRQALRDMPQQEGFPIDVVWPEMPA
jgi:hypothetical protein